MRRSRKYEDDPAYEEARRAFAQLGFDLDRDSVAAESRRLGLTDPHPNDPFSDWPAFVAAAAPEARDPWRDDHLNPEAWSAAIPVVLVGELELDPFDLTLELEQPVGPEALDVLSALIAEAARMAGTDEDGHISWWSDGRPIRPLTGLAGATWTLDAASAGPRTVERLIDAIVRGVVILAIPVRRLVLGHPT